MKYIYFLIIFVGLSTLSFFAGKQSAEFVPNQDESQQANEIQEYATYLIGGGTLVALLVQCVIFARQEAAMRRTAELAEDAMTIAKWPYLYIKNPEFITPLGTQASIPPVFEYWLVVFGESHAVIRRLYQKLIFSEETPPPARPDESNWETSDHFIKQKEKEGWERQVIVADISEAARESWGSPSGARKKYFFVGCVIYDDVFGNQHELAFCYWAPRAGGIGIKYGGSKYNYHRRISEDNRV